MTLYAPKCICPKCKKEYFDIEFEVSDHHERCPKCDIECEPLPFEQWETISDNTFY